MLSSGCQKEQKSGVVYGSSFVLSPFEYLQLYEFSAYVKVEKNGIELSYKNFFKNIVSKLKLAKLKTHPNENACFLINNSKNETIFVFPESMITKIYNKNTLNGVMSIVFENGPETFSVFISKTTKEILDHFSQKLIDLKEKRENLIKEVQIQTNPKVSFSNNQDKLKKNLNPALAMKLEKKQQLKELYKEYGKEPRPNPKPEGVRSNNNLGIKPPDLQNKVTNIKGVIPINKKQSSFIKGYLLSYPVISFFIFDFLDKENLKKCCILNKQMKDLHDSYMCNLVFRPDTPEKMFIRLLRRFNNITTLDFGNPKNIKNDTIKSMEFSLRSIETLKLSTACGYLNETSLINILKKTSNKSLRVVHFSQYKDCILSILQTIRHDHNSITDLYLEGPNFAPSRYLEEINKIGNAFFSMSYSNSNYKLFYNDTINKIILSIISIFNNLTKVSLDSFSLWMIELNYKINFFGTTPTLISKNENKSNQINPASSLSNISFSKLRALSINYLYVDSFKQIKLLSTAIHLEQLCINEIVIFKSSSKMTFSRFYTTNQQQVPKVEYEFLNLEDKEYTDAGVDYDEDYLDVFSYFFSKLKKITLVSFGSFANSQILKIMTLYWKSLLAIQISSLKINDDDIRNLLLNCKLLNNLDLRGCFNVTGDCFITGMTDKDFVNLKQVKLSITSHNYFRIINYLREVRGISAQNYL